MALGSEVQVRMDPPGVRGEDARAREVLRGVVGTVCAEEAEDEVVLDGWALGVVGGGGMAVGVFGVLVGFAGGGEGVRAVEGERVDMVM